MMDRGFKDCDYYEYDEQEFQDSDGNWDEWPQHYCKHPRGTGACEVALGNDCPVTGQKSPPPKEGEK